MAEDDFILDWKTRIDLHRELAALTRAEIRKLMKEKDSADAIETMPTAAD